MTPAQVPNGPLLVDTDVFSYWYRAKGPLWQDFQALATGHPLAMAFSSLGEALAPTYSGAVSTQLSARIRTAAANFVVLPYDADVVERWAEMAPVLRESLKGKGVNDLWTAACALSHGMPLVTNNLSDFVKVRDKFPSLVLVHPTL